MDTAASLGIRRYAALGDSYTSGPLIPWQRLDHIGCFRSTNNYPAQLARRLDLPRYVDASCAGADTSHITEPQEVPFGSNPPQLAAVTPDTDLVTVGIGGNDFGTFGQIVGTCPGLRQRDPDGAPCRRHFTDDGVDTILARMPRIEERVAGVLRRIRSRAPDATVLLVGYPRLVPRDGTCPEQVPFADGDYTWADHLERTLNGVLHDAAQQTGATYVDTYHPSRRHSACAGRRAWVNGQHTDLFRAASYHPFVSYMAAAASLIHDLLSEVPPSEERALAAAEDAERELADLTAVRLDPAARVVSLERRELLERAAAEAGVHHGGTTPGALAPTRAM